LQTWSTGNVKNYCKYSLSTVDSYMILNGNFFSNLHLWIWIKERFLGSILFFFLSFFFVHNKWDAENNWKYFKFIFTLDSYMILNENFFYKLHLWIWLKEGVVGLILFSILTFVNKINWGYEKYLKVYE
jgi:hypothetical protein